MQNALAQERSVSVAYYILTGKQSIQTIQDAKLFHLESYSGEHRSLNKHDYTERLDSPVHSGFLQAVEESNHFQLTHKAHYVLNHPLSLLQQYSFQGIHYHSIPRTFYTRLLL